MTVTTAPMCMGCRHFKPDAPALVCDAYPDGIPAVILDSEVDHRRPVPGDNGILFEPESPADARYAVELFGLATAMPFFAFDPNQPRDRVGRFGTKGSGGGASRMSLAEATDALGAMGVKVGLGMASIHPEARAELVSAIGKAHDKVPEFFKSTEITVQAFTKPGRVADMVAVTDVFPHPNPGSYAKTRATMTINQDLFSDPAALHAEVRRGGESGLMAGGTVEHYIVHEVGHAFDEAVGKPSLDDPAYIAGAGRSRAPSQHAKTSTEERFAEQFALEVTGHRAAGADGAIVRKLIGDNG